MVKILVDRQVIKLSGDDRLSFLDGLLTNKVDDMSLEESRYAALLTPQGKVISEFLVFRVDDALFLDVSAKQSEAVIKRLTMYKLRAAVEVRLAENLAVAIFDRDEGAGQMSNLVTLANDPRNDTLPPRGIVKKAEYEMKNADDYKKLRFANAVAEGDEILADKDFWLETGAERLNGVDFTKGCYVGQELTARMKHRTSIKKVITTLRSDSIANAGDEIINENGQTAGTVRAFADGVGLAMIRFDRITDSMTLHEGPVAVDIPDFYKEIAAS